LLTNGACVCRHITLNLNNPEVEGQEQELKLINLGVYPEMTIETLRSSIEAEGIPAPAQHIYHNGQLITDNTKTLQELQITDGDMLALHVRDMRGSGIQATPQTQAARRRPAAGAGGAPSLPQDPELIRLHILGDPAQRRQLERQNPVLAAAIEDPQRFAQIFHQAANQQEDARLARIREIRALNEAEFDPAAQARIEDMIRQERVMENLQNAMEHNPECMSPKFRLSRVCLVMWPPRFILPTNT
jgi:DNA damage-inducible protein 1